MLTSKTLKQARQALGLSQRDVADAAGLSGSYVCYLEAGRREISAELSDRLEAAMEAAAMRRREQMQAAVERTFGRPRLAAMRDRQLRRGRR